MPFYWFALTISMMLASACTVGPRHPWQILVATAMNVLAWGVLAKTAVWYSLVAAHQSAHTGDSLRDHHLRFRKLINWVLWTWIPAGVACVGMFGLGELITAQPWAQASLLLRFCAIFAPSLLVLAIAWGCEYQWTCWLQSQLDPASRPVSLVRHLFDNFRTQGGWLLLPMLVLLFGADTVRWLLPVDSPIPAPAFLPLLLLCLAWALPHLVSRIWTTVPLRDAAIESWIATAYRGRLPVRLWKTRGNVSTAMVIGFLPRGRLLLLSDRLLEELDGPQRAMVVFHELAHLGRWHLPLRLASLLPIAAGNLIGWWWNRSAAVPNVMVYGLALATGAVASALLMRFLAHWTELDADQAACALVVRAAQSDEQLPTTRQAAAEILGTTLVTLMRDEDPDRSGWFHPSLNRRLSALRREIATTDRMGSAVMAFSPIPENP